MNINELQCTPVNVNAHQRTPMNTSERQRALTFVVFLGLVMSLAIGCHQAAPTSSRPLTQRGYLWQRAWNSAVADALTQAENRLDGVVILGAEILWSGNVPQTLWQTI